MSKILATWFFLLFSILTYSAYGTTCTEDTGDLRTSKPQQKELKPMDGMIIGPSKPCSPRKLPELNAARQTRISRLGKAAYRGASNLRPHNVRNASNSNSFKPPSLFMAALGHLVLGLLLVPCLYRIT